MMRPAARKQTWGPVLGWVLATALIAIAAYVLGRNLEGNSKRTETAFVARVIDGDTIQLADGLSVRYIGINTPETTHPTKGLQCFGPEATERNRELVEGKMVELIPGIEDKDKYGRLLRYVFVDGVFVNAELISEGYAREEAYGSERRYQQVFVQLEQFSIVKGRGLWSACAPETE